MAGRHKQVVLGFALFAVLVSRIATAWAATDTYGQSTLTVRQSDIQRCSPVEQLSKLRVAIEERESPIMRQVFAWLFPFGPAWNSSTYHLTALPG
jgi:solute carrier family 39 (zinc transporter), member 7